MEEEAKSKVRSGFYARCQLIEVNPALLLRPNAMIKCLSGRLDVISWQDAFLTCVK